MESRLRIDEQCVQDFVSLFNEWKYNLFDPEKQNLWTLQTVAHASKELVNDFESFYEVVDHLFKIQSIPD